MDNPRCLTYVLDDDGNPLPCPDVIVWATWFHSAPRHVGQDFVEGPPGDRVRVSTVFLGIDHRFSDGGPPILYETMVFGGPISGEQRRYATWAEAIEGHKQICAIVQVQRQQAWRKIVKHGKLE